MFNNNNNNIQTILTIQVLAFEPMKESLNTFYKVTTTILLPSRPVQLVQLVHPTYLCQCTASEWKVDTLLAQRSNALLNTQNKESLWTHYSITNVVTFRAKRLLLISAPSNLVFLSEELVSAPLSLPAKSIRESLP